MHTIINYKYFNDHMHIMKKIFEQKENFDYIHINISFFFFNMNPIN